MVWWWPTSNGGVMTQDLFVAVGGFLKLFLPVPDSTSIGQEWIEANDSRNRSLWPNPYIPKILLLHHTPKSSLKLVHSSIPDTFQNLKNTFIQWVQFFKYPEHFKNAKSTFILRVHLFKEYECFKKLCSFSKTFMYNIKNLQRNLTFIWAKSRSLCITFF